MSFEELREIQAYVYFFFVLFLVVVLYSYIYQLYKDQKSGKRDYEKYSKLALDDSISSSPLEPLKKDEEEQRKES
jgi:cytochrome c oxidase cbb3-type subunit 4